MSFQSLGLSKALLKAINNQGYTEPSPIQQKAIPLILKGKDILASAQTGTGKTAGFTLPMLQRLSQGQSQKRRKVRALIITPTRELAAQVHANVKSYSEFLNIQSTVIFGGVNQRPQVATLKRGVDVLIATPGRLLDLQNQGFLSLSNVEILVLDEADRMLDMGFYDDIMKISNTLPKNRQTLLFSATMPPKIRELANKLLKNPESISLAISKPAEGITQSAYMCHDSQKVNLVREILRAKGRDLSHVLIFASSIKSVREIKTTLNKAGMKASEMHSGLDQDQREQTIRDFKSKKIKILVATDILSRGIDIKGIEIVINYEVPHDEEDYVHRIGRTARADRTGEAITFINPKQVKNFKDIEKLIEKEVPKLELPKGFSKAPEYKILSKNKKNKKWRNFKKQKPTSPK